jgi:hypothetical protein
MSEGYNGWTNYETWNYALWLDNEQGSQEHAHEMAQECFDNADADSTFSKIERAQLDMADMLKAECEEYAEEWMPKQSGPFADAVNCYISEINWYEIAGHYMQEVECEVAA